MQISNFSNFSETENSSRLLSLIFPYFIYTVPQIVLLCILMFVISYFFKRWEVTKAFRRYSFFWWNLWSTLVEGNLAYFSYISFSNLQLPFSFTPSDKASLFFTLLFLFFLVAYVLLYYVLLHKFLKFN